MSIAEGLNEYANYLKFKRTDITEILRVMPDQYDTIALFFGNQGGKCLDFQTPINLTDGRVVEIQHVKRGDKVFSLSENLMVETAKVLNRIESGKRQTIIVTLRSGRTLIATPEHPYYGINGWMPISVFDVGDYVAVPRRLPLRKGKSVDSWKPIILGYLVGDGGITGGTANFTNVDSVILDEITSVLPDGVNLTNSNGDITYRMAGNGKAGENPVINLLKETGLYGCNSHTKFVPDIILQADLTSIGMFISRLFSCDGWVDEKGVGYCSVSKKLIFDIQTLLLRFGINTRIRTKSVKYKGSRNIAYEIGIRRTADIKTFSDKIGIFSKQDKLDNLLEKKNQTTSKENYDVVPISVEFLYDEIPREYIKGKQGRYPEYLNRKLYYLLRESRGATITRGKLLKIAKAFENSSLRKLAESDIFWDKIVSIKDGGVRQTYDLEVEGTHNFVANNIFAHNTSSVAYHYFQRVLGIHPSEKRNRLAKKIRCMSSSLPESSSPEEQDNTQYLELKKLIPPEMIIKDITARSQNLVVRRPVGISSQPAVFEFRSSKQELQDLGKIQLSSVWHDEETPKMIREECRMRLLAEGGDEIFSLTPINALTYTYDDIWQMASYIYRTRIVAEKFNLPRVEKHPGKNKTIMCMQAATDDNPTLDRDTIERIFEGVTDPDELALRRYGVFKQVSGRIHKTYNPLCCYISYEKYFPDGVPYKWVHARGIDYHESRTPWSIGWLSGSPMDEWFLWQEFHPAIDGPNAYNTYEICMSVLRKSGDYNYTVNLIDPLANKKQANTLFSTTDDINRHCDDIRREDGLGMPSYWQAWDTKGTTGRNEISKRFKNAVRCGVPFNNQYKDKGVNKRLPTLWICDTCPQTHKSILNWRYGEYVQSTAKAVNDPKNYPQQKFSHDNMVLECLAKSPQLVHAGHFFHNLPPLQGNRRTSITGR